ncbi:hypothetical protein [Bartonella senegalensis]|uniref:hypothetical protein n=1 Tax=Bartonella senegalensis TaxID=1468418 RepID=UPI0002FB947D|nr:hypothetical protein [Bartonella senegalensis]
MKQSMRIVQTVIAPVLQVNVCALVPKQNGCTKNNAGSRGTKGRGRKKPNVG